MRCSTIRPDKDLIVSNNNLKSKERIEQEQNKKKKGGNKPTIGQQRHDGRNIIRMFVNRIAMSVV